jgi:CubicO group peptidase (beta-lactamase class C family)
VDQGLDFSQVDALLDAQVASGVVPGASICIRSTENVLHRYTVGQAELRPSPRPATNDTVWDLASLTKVLATTPIAMSLVAEGRLDLHAPVTHHLPDAPAEVTAAQLLSHSSGLAPWVPFFEALGHEASGTMAGRDEVLRRARQAELLAKPGLEYAYSDLGFLTLCALLERVGEMRLDGLFERYVRGPSGVDLRFGWPGAAATEDCPFRGRMVVGEVHDLNAWTMGGVSSHAGLFGTAASVAGAAAWQLRAWAGDADVGLDPDTVRRFFGAQGAGSHHWGWDGVSPGGSAGPLWPKDGVGHLAFTGCSVWIAPEADLVVALTTNRLHPEIEGGAVPGAPLHPRYAAFKAARPAIHTAVVEALIDESRWPL